jgi:hypothetical protein
MSSILPYNLLSEVLLAFPGNMFSATLNNLQGTGGAIPVSMLICTDLTSFHLKLHY